MSTETKQRRKRRSFTAEFKAEAVRLVLEEEKSGGLLREGDDVKFAFIHAQKAHFPIAFMCEQLEVSRSGY
jgi:hypothetical protein